MARGRKGMVRPKTPVPIARGGKAAPTFDPRSASRQAAHGLLEPVPVLATFAPRSDAYRLAPVSERIDDDTYLFEHPYDGVPEEHWHERARQLLETFPLAPEQVSGLAIEIVEAYLADWHAGRTFGLYAMRDLGKAALQTPIHDSLTHGFGLLDGFRREAEGKEKEEKDVLCLLNAFFGFEVKTSRDLWRVTTNRSSLEPSTDPKARAKSKSKESWYLFVVYETGTQETGGRVQRVAMGYLSPSDFDNPEKTKSGRKRAGQRASISLDHPKLVELYSHPTVDRIREEVERKRLADEERAAQKAFQRRQSAGRKAARTRKRRALERARAERAAARAEAA